MIYLFIAIPIKLPKYILWIKKQIISHFIWKNKWFRISREVMKRNSREGGLALPDLKLDYKAAIIKATLYWLRNRGVDQWNMLGTQDAVVNEHSNLLFNKLKYPRFWGTNSLFDTNCGEN